MSDKVFFVVIGLTIGFVSFAAVGAATSLLMEEVQQHVAAQAQPSPTSYAQVRPGADRVMR
ncbi:MAG TPA: hypothetical protein VJQ55_12225 [Candidatus Binatia bacterium]|nr:hypothetical protein [Candidatus Binatia bacterium]